MRDQPGERSWVRMAREQYVQNLLLNLLCLPEGFVQLLPRRFGLRL